MTYADPRSTLAEAWRRDPAGVVGLYLFAETGHFAPGWLAFVEDMGRANDLRQSYRSLRLELERPPWLLTPPNWRRLALLAPAQAASIANDARTLWGEPLTPPVATEDQRAAALAEQLWAASAALTADVLAPETAEAARRRLQALAAEHAVAGATPGAILAALHATLRAELPPAVDAGSPRQDAPPLLPALRALFRWGDALIMVLPDNDETAWRGADWHALAHAVTGECRQLLVTTLGQLQAIARSGLAFETLLGQLQHVWGPKLLSQTAATPRAAWHQLGREAAVALHRDLARAYLDTPDEMLGQLIHDYQNRLHNFLLRHEIMARSSLVPARATPPPLPSRDAPPHERIAAIFSQLDWWADSYARLVKET